MRNRIENQILAIQNSADRAILLATLKKEDYSFLFRQSSSTETSLDLTKFLYQNKDELKLDVNAKGQISKKGALEIAIDNKAEDTVLYLLKLKEIETNETIIDKIDEKFGSGFKKYNITNPFVSVMKKFDERLPKVQELISGNLKMSQQIIEKRQTEFEQPSINITIESINESYAQFMGYSGELHKSCAGLEETYARYLTLSYACEKTMKNNMDFKQHCIKHRSFAQNAFDVIQRSQRLSLDLIDAMIARCILDLTKFYVNVQEESIQRVEEGNDLTLADSSSKEEEITVESAEPTAIIPALKDISEPKSTNHASLEMKPKKRAHKEPNKKVISNAPPQKTLPQTAANNRLERLIGFQQQLSDLKQKGQVKSSLFLGILQDIGQEIDLQFKKTKSGLLVSQGDNQFSFHKPHKKDKGIDKAAVQQMKAIVVEKIKEQQISSEVNFNKNP